MKQRTEPLQTTAVRSGSISQREFRMSASDAKTMFGQPRDLGGEGFRATGKRPQSGAVNDVREPLSGGIGFNMAGAGDVLGSQDRQIEQFGVERCHRARGIDDDHHQAVSGCFDRRYW